MSKTPVYANIGCLASSWSTCARKTQEGPFKRRLRVVPTILFLVPVPTLVPPLPKSAAMAKGDKSTSPKKTKAAPKAKGGAEKKEKKEKDPNAPKVIIACNLPFFAAFLGGTGNRQHLDLKDPVQT
jgi:hypothetical protein